MSTLINIRSLLLKSGFTPRSFVWSLGWKLSRALFQIRNLLLFGRPLHIVIHEVAFDLAPQGAAAAGLWLGLRWEHEEIGLALGMLNSEMILIDIGTNAGVFALPVGKKLSATKGMIYAFEPTEWTFELLQKNIRLNGLEETIHAYRMAIGDYSGEAILNVNPLGKDDLNSIGLPHTWHFQIAARECVPITSLDEFLVEKKITRVDLVKVDVEGAELLVFHGGKRLLEHEDAPVIIFESFGWCTAGFGYEPKEALSFLNSLGYQFFKFDPSTHILVPCTVGNHNATIVAVKPGDTRLQKVVSGRPKLS